ncbi:heterokaryon incompatibility protein-domain-containing protein [Chaetomium sp. MPI-CAGE-AT-0009]|nr:heterokaryon incompatibility protein-domain-containing protein [Chaetomium sp. MPI-CAGE-AT-0009]
MGGTSTSTCAVCQDLEPCHLEIPVAKLLDAIARGCKACTLLRDAVSPFAPFSEIETIRTRVDCALYVYAYLKELQGRHLTVEVYADPKQPPRWKCIGPARPVPATASSTESIGLIKRWLDDCQTRHPSCGAPQPASLPTRVIDVGESSENVSLYVSSGEQASYAALSHCWGEQTPLSTTRATVEEHQRSIRFDPKSRTFAEAVEVTRGLGLRYLWIDSLCIIQDDPDDWVTEAAKMSQVYSNAALTLSADGAEDASKGLFGGAGARVLAQNTHIIATAAPDGTAGTVPVHARLRSSRPSDPGNAPHSSLPTRPSKLSTRAWVLQERILSQRIIHFYNEELVWSCFGQSRCECRLMAGTSSFGTFCRLIKSSDPATSARELPIEWTRLVEEFTSKGLTYPTDRLSALSGLAALTHQNLTSSAARYLAGLWSTDMEYSLLWISDHAAAAGSETRVGRMPVTPFAPSWSWASVVGPVQYIHRHLDQFTSRRSGMDEIKPVFQVVGATAEPLTSNLYGPVKDGFVTVRGQLLPVVFDLLGGDWRPAPRGDGGPGGEVVGRFGESRMEAQMIPDVLDEDPRFNHDAAMRTLASDFVMLRVATYIWDGWVSSEGTEVVAMLLEKVPDGTQASGRRVYTRRGIVLHAFHKMVWEGVPAETIVIA